MFKKLVKVSIVMLISLSLVACTGKKGEEVPKGPVVLKVWGSQEDQAFLGEQIEKFKATQPKVEWEITLGVVSEADAKELLTQDLDTGADVFAFADDQLLDLVNAEALYEITRNKADIMKDNGAGSVDAATVGESLYAYPMTADNGYFLYYDASVFTEDDVNSFEKMLEVAATKNKKVHMDLGNSWYIASFFLGAGGKLDMVDGKQVTDFNNPAGVLAGEAIRKITSHPAYTTGDDTILTAGMGDTIAAGVSGTWNATVIEEALGENYRATKLPQFDLGGKQTQLASFGGYKLMGVKSSTKHPIQAMDLAQFLTSEDAQIARFEARGYGPSNTKAAQNPKVLENKALAALSMQAEFAVSQKYVGANYWGPAEAFGIAMVNKDTTDMKTLLDQMV
ncbi:MAG: extracellular solute-binding protein, partial [Corynebacterium sp.]|nr:extracellular solute-binding protein [Corynebacterium sp.]